MKTLVVGPWPGEFGHEIGVWQANARERARKYDRVIVGCVKTSEALYQDFADEFWNIPSDHNTSGLGRCDQSHHKIIQSFAKTVQKEGADWMKPERLSPCPAGFKRFGSVRDWLKFDVVIHAREMVKGTKGGDRRRCWRLESWDRLGWTLESLGLKTACIGLPEVAVRIPLASDFRGCPLDLTMDLLRSSRCLVGPSSGPIHLGILCECPVVVWTDTNHRSGYTGRTNVDHLLLDWNPFDTPVKIIHGWNPDVSDILNKIEAVHDANHSQARRSHH